MMAAVVEAICFRLGPARPSRLSGSALGFPEQQWVVRAAEKGWQDGYREPPPRLVCRPMQWLDRDTTRQGSAVSFRPPSAENGEISYPMAADRNASIQNGNGFSGSRGHSGRVSAQIGRSC